MKNIVVNYIIWPRSINDKYDKYVLMIICRKEAIDFEL